MKSGILLVRKLRVLRLLVAKILIVFLRNLTFLAWPQLALHNVTFSRPLLLGFYGGGAGRRNLS